MSSTVLNKTLHLQFTFGLSRALLKLVQGLLGLWYFRTTKINLSGWLSLVTCVMSHIIWIFYPLNALLCVFNIFHLCYICALVLRSITNCHLSFQSSKVPSNRCSISSLNLILVCTYCTHNIFPCIDFCTSVKYLLLLCLLFYCKNGIYLPFTEQMSNFVNRLRLTILHCGPHIYKKLYMISMMQGLCIEEIKPVFVPLSHILSKYRIQHNYIGMLDELQMFYSGAGIWPSS